MRRRTRLAAYLGASLLVIGTTLSILGATPPAFQEIEESLTCQCGCGLTVASCNHMQCGSALPLRAEIREQLNLGKSKQEILAYFMGKYGEKILSSPTTKGFNLTAWVMPFALVGLGGLFVVVVLIRWTGRRPPLSATPDVGATTPQVPSEHERTLERELKDFEH
jgi:cytochrome c-type biogenesis protein CcmH